MIAVLSDRELLLVALAVAAVILLSRYVPQAVTVALVVLIVVAVVLAI